MLVSLLAFAAVMLIVVMAVQGLQEGEAEQDGINLPAVVTADGIRIQHNHVELTYFISFDNPETELRIVDAQGFVIETTFRQGRIMLRTSFPVMLLEQADGIHVLSPRDVYNQVIVIDAGHGGYDIGAPAPNGIRESDIVLAISHYLYELFAASNSGITAFMIRHGDDFVTPADRAHFANAVGHMKISIHTNAFSDPLVAGTETLFNPNANPSNAIFAQIVQNHVVAELGTRDRGIVVRTDLYQLATTHIPTALAEIDFKTNPQALENLNSSEYRQRIALALYRAIVQAFEEL